MPKTTDPTPDDVTPLDATAVPLDPVSTRVLADRGLTYRVIDRAGEDFDHFVQAVERGFLGERSSPEQVAGWRETIAGTRPVGVFDDSSVQPETPVATVNSWADELTVDVERFLPVWAISAVTVSATHRRRGIARAMLEGELRAAAAAGLPIAGLTVSEATIYGRYGFAPVALGTRWTIDARRAGWAGPRPTEDTRPGRLDPIERETARDDAIALHRVVRRGRPGEVAAWDGLWRGMAGLAPGQKDGGRVRAVRYTDADGEVRGVLIYSIEVNQDDFTMGTLVVRALVAEGSDAHAALWRFALEHDLVSTVRAGEMSPDDPLRWLVVDQRALDVRETDHHWLRVLDVATCLQSRTYRVPGQVTFRVSDPLGFADGTWRLEVTDDGAGTVTAVEGATAVPSDGLVELSAAELAALLLGGVRAGTLAAAGRLRAGAPTLAWLDLAFAPLAPPRLSVWY
ncbi:MAG: GNAT family N-acetyltransferase [Cellulomonadaceae bacterium]